MKRLILAGFSVTALSIIASAPAHALTQRFTNAYQANLNKSVPTAEVKLSDRQRESHIRGFYRLTERFDDERYQTLNR